ncbi:MAG: hypothetical protein E7256_09600 [Lachnospiraceae bacterium]|nr:hypothetical protein [Lachnospiraceae bacterium]
MQPTQKQDLFIITGASGIGKTSACEVLFQKEKDYVVMESDLLWRSEFNHPENEYGEYRSLWMRLCANISQIGMPVVLCGCGIPKQFETREERKLFQNIHYIAVVAEEACLETRMREGRNIKEEEWIESSKQFNHWLKEHASQTNPKITLIDNTNLSIEQTAEQIDAILYTYIKDIPIIAKEEFKKKDILGKY